MGEREWELSEHRRSWISRTNDTEKSVYVSLRGRIPLSDLIAYVDQHRVEHADVGVNFATITWVDAATPQEIEERRDHNWRAAERQAEWEAKTYAKLHAKFGGCDPAALGAQEGDGDE